MMVPMHVDLALVLGAVPAAAPPGFAAFTPAHGLVLVGAALVLTPFLRAGARWRAVAPARERRLRVGFALGIIAAQIVNIVYWAMPARFDPAISLPIHVCDLIPWVSAAALLAPAGRGRWACTLAYFWGLGLSSWGFIYPVLETGPDTFRFWLFWLVHGQIVGAALFIAVVDPWRPTGRDLGFAVVAVIAYAALITPVNLAIPADYGYVGPGDGPTSLLGPWPWRVPIVLAGQAALFGLLYLPWRGRRPASAPPISPPRGEGSSPPPR
jgi:hypothetical integral membrane protein (TIGR02206 family)